VQGERYDLEDLFDDFEVSEELRDKIVSHLGCKNCGTPLNRGDEIGLEDKFDREVTIHVNEANKKYGKKIKEFRYGIEKFPTLALQYSLAKDIFKEIREKCLPTCSVEGIYFRARKVINPDVLETKDFLPPPIGKSEEGRFNHAGQSHFYLSEKKETAINECLLENSPTLLWLLEFRIQKINNILDLSFDWEILSPSTSTLFVALHNSKVLMQSNENMEKWKPDYFITRFIMDCAKNEGYNGIKYDSVKHKTGKNLVLFDFKKETIIKYEKPEIIIYDPVSEKEQFNRMLDEFELNY
jgi:RES domain-containing protein